MNISEKVMPPFHETLHMYYYGEHICIPSVLLSGRLWLDSLTYPSLLSRFPKGSALSDHDDLLRS